MSLSLPFLVFLSTLDTITLAMHLPRQRLPRSVNTTDEPRVCKRDHVVITATSAYSDSIIPLLMVSSDNQLSELRLGAVDDKMSRKDLFSFESMDLRNQQWTLRTSDSSHLAIDSEGKLIIEYGCITTTFLRIVSGKHLEKCLEGVACTMALCATRIGMNESYIVSSNYSEIRPHALPLGSCATLRDFRHQPRTTNLNLELYEVTIRSAASLRHRASRGLKRLCPHLYDSPAQLATTMQMCKME